MSFNMAMALKPSFSPSPMDNTNTNRPQHPPSSSPVSSTTSSTSTMSLSTNHHFPIHSMSSSLSSFNSTTSLDSLFLRFDLAPTSTLTPIATSPQQHMLKAKDVCDLLHKTFAAKTLVVLVGLPASGKSTVCKQLAQMLKSNDYKTLIYNAGNIRRMMKQTFSDADFFNPTNEQAKSQRELYATMSMENMLDDFRHNRITVGFLDATNTTRARRARMLEMAKASGINFANIIVLDISCTDDRLITYNIAGKASNVDYSGRDVDESIADFKQRTNHYFKIYEPVSEAELAKYEDVEYISIRNGGKEYTFSGSKAKNDVDMLFHNFASQYYNLHGEKYYDEVERFYLGVKKE